MKNVKDGVSQFNFNLLNHFSVRNLEEKKYIAILVSLHIMCVLMNILTFAQILAIHYCTLNNVHELRYWF